MLKMLIVDDEKIIREGIRDIVNWTEYGIEIAGIAANGIEAISIYEKYLPQIVITDVKMPKMDGLELTRYLSEKKTNVKVIILSGYEEFSYAQEALKLGAEDYLLKPVVPDKLIERVMQLRETCEFEQKKRDDEDKLLQQIQESLPVLKEKFLWELVSGNFNDRTAILERAEYLNMHSMERGSFGVIIIHLDSYRSLSEDYSEKEKQLLNRSVENYIKEAIKGVGEVFGIKSGEFGILVNLEASSESQGEYSLQLICEAIQGILQSRCQWSTTIGIGRLYNDILNIPDSFYEAGEAVKYKLVLGKGQIIFIGDIECNPDYSSRHSDELEKDIVFTVKNGDKSRIHQCVENYYRIHLKKVDIEYIRWVSMKLLYAVSISLADSGESISDVMGREPELWECLSQYDTLQEVQDWIEGILLEIADRILMKRCTKNKPVIDKVIEYLNKHYMENFSLKNLADEIYLSPNYICSLFKQEVGRNISDYLTLVRIEKAKELLMDHRLKVYEISNMLGFTDSRYFNKIFKKYTGMNLTEFRENKS